MVLMPHDEIEDEIGALGTDVQLQVSSYFNQFTLTAAGAMGQNITVAVVYLLAKDNNGVV
eukprot:516414-Pyramimonas_sp.AAC.2